MGPPPPPPPPPILKPSAPLPFSGRKTTNAPRRDNNPVPSPSQPARLRVDSQALQHAASRLRKTGYHEQIRSDVPDLPNGRVDGQNEHLSGQHWQNSQKQQKLDSHQAREPVHAPPSGGYEHRPLNNLHRNPNSVLNNQVYSKATGSNTFDSNFNSSPSIVTANSTSTTTTDYSPTPKVYSHTITTTTTSNFDNPINRNNFDHISTGPNKYSPHHENPSSSSSYYASSSKMSSPSPQYPTYSRVYQRDEPDHHQQFYTNSQSFSPVTDPHARIHNFATQNYVQEDPRSFPDPRFQNRGSEETRTITTSNVVQTNPFAVELRDRGLTASQREANQFRQTQRRIDSQLPFDVNQLVKESFRGDEVDHLVVQMANQLRGNDMDKPPASDGPPAQRTNVMQRSNICVGCNNPITFENPGCVALDQVFHVSCFNCKKCGKILAGSSFYNIDNSPTCETCYTESLDKCTKCSQPISDKLLRACGGTFHVECFVCTVCDAALDGVPFTVDSDNNVHCVPCFHEKFAPRCAVCKRGIIPVEGEKESVRVVAMDKSFHVECYRCEDCGLQLSSKIEGQGCYPLDSHLYCKTCNSNRLRVLASA